MLATGKMPHAFVSRGPPTGEILALYLGSSGLSKERLGSPICCSQACSHLKSCSSVCRSKMSWFLPLFPLIQPRPILSSPCHSLTSSGSSPRRLHPAHQQPLMSPHPLCALDGQLAAVDLGLKMLALLPLYLLPQGLTAALLTSGHIWSGLEVHPIQATERGLLGGCSLGPLVLVATSDRTRERLVLRKNLILFIFCPNLHLVPLSLDTTETQTCLRAFVPSNSTLLGHLPVKSPQDGSFFSFCGSQLKASS